MESQLWIDSVPTLVDFSAAFPFHYNTSAVHWGYAEGISVDAHSVPGRGRIGEEKRESQNSCCWCYESWYGYRVMLLAGHSFVCGVRTWLLTGEKRDTFNLTAVVRSVMTCNVEYRGACVCRCRLVTCSVTMKVLVYPVSQNWPIGTMVALFSCEK